MLKTWLYLGLLKHSGNAGPLPKFALPSGCACEGACRHPTSRLGTCSLVRETKMPRTTVNNSSARGLRPVTCKQQFSNLGSRGLHLFWIGPSKFTSLPGSSRPAGICETSLGEPERSDGAPAPGVQSAPLSVTAAHRRRALIRPLWQGLHHFQKMSHDYEAHSCVQH